MLAQAAASGSSLNQCDLNGDGVVNNSDVMLAVNMSLGMAPCTANIDGADICTCVEVQRVINASLGGTCVIGNPHSVSLSWTASTSTGVSGYNVYRGATSGGPYAKENSTLVNATNYNDTTVSAGQTYYYVTTAVDGSGNESSYSNQAVAAIPYP